MLSVAEFRKLTEELIGTDGIAEALIALQN